MLHHPVMLLQRCALFHIGIILGMCVNFITGHMGGKKWRIHLNLAIFITCLRCLLWHFGHKAMNMKIKKH